MYINYYYCENCDMYWQDMWSCMCNDRCGNCDTEIEPFQSDDIDDIEIIRKET